MNSEELEFDETAHSQISCFLDWQGDFTCRPFQCPKNEEHGALQGEVVQINGEEKPRVFCSKCSFETFRVPGSVLGWTHSEHLAKMHAALTHHPVEAGKVAMTREVF